MDRCLLPAKPTLGGPASAPFDDHEAPNLPNDGLGQALERIGVGEETLREPLRLKPFEHWVGHIPFAFWMVSALRPRILVEIGTHRGNSFLAFCQAIEVERCGTRAYAVDTWEGDAHMAREEGLFEELSTYHDPRYGHFSSLVRATFDEARELFPDHSIDLLHIDGTHTYEAVGHDFATWASALSDRAVVLFHDTNVRRPHYGVWKLWEELAHTRPHFEFFHSFGLGVLGVGTDLPERVRALFDASCDETAAARIRSFFAARGAAGINRLAMEVEHERAYDAGQRVDELAAQLERELSARSTEAAGLRQHVQALEVHSGKLERELSARSTEAAGLRQHVQALEVHSGKLERELSARSTEADGLRRQVAVRTSMQAEMDQRGQRVDELAALLRDSTDAAEVLRGELAVLRSHCEEVERLSEALHASRSWRVTAPLRSAGLGLRKLRRGCYFGVALTCRFAYRALPLPIGVKLRLKHSLFDRMGTTFAPTGAYLRWQEMLRQQAAAAADAAGPPIAAPPTDFPPPPPELAALPPLWAAEVLPIADGHWEWQGYAGIRGRIAEVLAARRAALPYRPRPMIELGEDDLAQAAARIALKPSGTIPEISVLVPVFNELASTIECLLSLDRRWRGDIRGTRR